MLQLILKPKYFGFLLLSSIWFSLDTNITKSFDEMFQDTFNYLSIFSILRILAPYILLIIFLQKFSKYLNFKIKTKNLNFIITILIFNFLIQFCGIFIYQEETLLNNSNLIYLCLISLAFFTTQFNLDNSKTIFIFSLIILFIIFSWFSLVMVEWYFSSDNETANLYGGWPSAFQVIEGLTENIPRSSGIARMAIILLIPLLLGIVTNKRVKILYYLLYNYCFCIILLTQSRIILFGLFLMLVVSIFYIILNNLKNITKIKKIFYIFFIPLILFTSMVIFKSYTLTTQNEKNFKIDGKGGGKDFRIGGKNFKIIRIQDHNSFTSRRFDDWKKIIKNNSNVFFGNGAMGDRWIIKQSASNLFLYNYASSGIIGVFIFGIVILRSLFICFKVVLIREKKISKHNLFLLSACFIQFLLMGRSLVESSFAVFGIDFLMFFSAYFFTEQYYDKKLIPEKNVYKKKRINDSFIINSRSK